jgi:hypothetical protein
MPPCRRAALQVPHPRLRARLHPAVQPAAAPPQPREPTREALRNAAADAFGPRSHWFAQRSPSNPPPPGLVLMRTLFDIN